MNFLSRITGRCAWPRTHPQPAQCLTPRGALVRDPQVLGAYIDEAIELFAGHSRRPVRPASLAALGARADRRLPHHAARPLRLHPRPGAAPAQQRLRRERDRRAAAAAAELEREWHCRGYYGSLNHNPKAVYQRYLGWFDGNPAHLCPHPPRGGRRALRRARGRRRALLAHAREAFGPATTAGWPRSSTTSCSPTPTTPRREELQARALEQLAYGAENGPWRNFYLMGAHELRNGVAGTAASVPRRLHRQPQLRAAVRCACDPDRRAACRRAEAHDALALHRHRTRSTRSRSGTRSSHIDTVPRAGPSTRRSRPSAPRSTTCSPLRRRSRRSRPRAD